MIEQGVVTEVSGKKATVKIDKKTECDKCGMCLFPKGASSTLISASNKIGASVGDKVTIETQKDAKFIGAVLVFLVPLILIGISAVIGLIIIKNELSVLLLSAGLIVIWFIILSAIDKKIKKLSGFLPEITAINQKQQEKN